VHCTAREKRATRFTASTAVRNSGDSSGQAATISWSSPGFCARSCASGLAANSEAAAATHACRSASTGSIPAWAANLQKFLNPLGHFLAVLDSLGSSKTRGSLVCCSRRQSRAAIETRHCSDGRQVAGWIKLPAVVQCHVMQANRCKDPPVPPPPLPQATTRGPATFLKDLHQPSLTKILPLPPGTSRPVQALLSAH
jgi:hypothetical protein